MPAHRPKHRRAALPREPKPSDPLATPSQPPFPLPPFDAIFEDFLVIRAARRRSPDAR
jgi:hypothetical protein